MLQSFLENLKIAATNHRFCMHRVPFINSSFGAITGIANIDSYVT